MARFRLFHSQLKTILKLKSSKDDLLFMAGANRAVFDELIQRSQRNLLEFINVELALGTTFVELALRDLGLGQRESVAHSKEIATSAVRTARRFAARLSADAARTAAEQRCAELESRISSF